MLLNNLFVPPIILFSVLIINKNVNSQQLCDNFGWTNIDGNCFRPFVYFVDGEQAKQLCAKVGGDAVSFIEETSSEYGHLVADEMRVAQELRLNMPGKKNGVLCKKPANNGQNNDLFDKICPNLATKWPISRAQLLRPAQAVQPIIKLRGQIGQPGRPGLPGIPGVHGMPGQTGQQLNGRDEMSQIAGSTGEPGLPGRDGQSGQVSLRPNELKRHGDAGRPVAEPSSAGRLGLDAESSADSVADGQKAAQIIGRNKKYDWTHSKSYTSSSVEKSGHRHRNGGSRSDTSVVVQIGYPFGGPSPTTEGRQQQSNGAKSSSASSSSSSSAAQLSKSAGKAMTSSASSHKTNLETDAIRSSTDFDYSDTLSKHLSDNNAQIGQSFDTSAEKSSISANSEESSSSIGLNSGRGLNAGDGTATAGGDKAAEGIDSSASSSNSAASSFALNSENSASSSSYMHKIRRFSGDETK